MKTTVLELMAWGHEVTRWHTMPSLRPQTLAAHSWGVAMIVMSVYDGSAEDKLLLVQAALEHDLAEKHIGDMPRPAKTEDHRRLEMLIADQHGLFHESVLPPSLQEWLAWADLMEAGLHAQREVALGNTHYVSVIERVRAYVGESKGQIPPALYELAVQAQLAPAHFPGD